MKAQIKDYLKTNLGIDEEEMLESLYSDYVATVDKLILNIRNGLSGGNTEPLKIDAHTLKGCSANVGDEPMHESAVALDRAAKAGDFSAFSTAFAEIEKCRGQFD